MNAYKHLIRKFLDGTASPNEVKKVLDWFESEEGQKFLDKQFDEDIERQEHFSMTSLQEEKTLEKLHSKIARQNIYALSQKKSRSHTSAWVVAAAIAFLVASLSYLNFFYENNKPVEKQPPIVSKVYTTDSRTHQIITLTDGTRIRLNENSSLNISNSYNDDSRAVTLTGEAFFDVATDSLRPFIVHSNDADIRVYGTKFIVKNSLNTDHIVVAVSEGRVGLGQAEEKPNSILEKNMVGLFDNETKKVTIENMDVTNYTSWIHGRVLFERTPFLKVVKQLNHIYGIKNELQDPELNNLRLTADFSEGTLENVINTIAHSLGIEAEIKGNVVTWTYPD